MTKISKVENIETINGAPAEPVKQKRGRKPKNVLITNNLDDKLVDNNIVFLIKETNT